jgi:hypothetical protein
MLYIVTWSTSGQDIILHATLPVTLCDMQITQAETADKRTEVSFLSVRIT